MSISHDVPANPIEISRDGSLVLTRAGSRALLWSRDEAGHFAIRGELAEARDDWSLRVSATGKWIAGCGDHSGCSIWDSRAKGYIRPANLVGRDQSPLGCVCEFTPDETRLVVVLRGGIVTVWDTTAQQMLDQWQTNPNEEVGAATWLDISADGQNFIVQTGQDGAFLTWGGSLSKGHGVEAMIQGDAAGELQLRAIRESAAPVVGPARELKTPDGTRLIAVSGDRTVRFIDTSTHREVAAFPMSAPVTALEMDAAGTRLLISLSDGTTRVWDIRPVAQRQQDVQRRWAERAEASKYLDRLWDGETPLIALDTAIRADRTLTELRRLVVSEMLQERMYELNSTANKALAELMKGETENAALDAKIKTSDLPRRVKEAVLRDAVGVVLKPAQEPSEPAPTPSAPKE